jgi:hypothetical protein
LALLPTHHTLQKSCIKTRHSCGLYLACMPRIQRLLYLSRTNNPDVLLRIRYVVSSYLAPIGYFEIPSPSTVTITLLSYFQRGAGGAQFKPLPAYLRILTFIGPCIVIYSYNKSQRDELFLSFILVKNSTCFGQIYCPSSGVLILYSQQTLFVIL